MVQNHGRLRRTKLSELKVESHLSLCVCLNYEPPKHKLDPDVAESVMLAVNSINSCPFCSGLHCDLARIAGTKRPYKIDKAKSLEEVVSYCDKRRDQVAVRYARVFAMTDGRGKKSEEAYEKLVST